MKQYSDSLPLNARVEIDYETDSVKFDYPNEPESKLEIFKRVVFPSLLITWILFLSIIFLISTFILSGITAVNQGINYVSPTAQEYFIYFLITIVCLVPPFIASIFVVFRYNWFKVYYPKFNAKVLKMLHLLGEYYVHETSLDKTVFEIPSFANVVLDYKTDGEFSDYLQKVVVEEHPFKYKIKRGNKITERKTDTEWRALFYFSQPPKTGNLWVNYL